ncbi:MAG: hypothetical protein ACXAEX_18215 [Promethearchaeota archaeon]|jgi:membrane-bound metal-dependent hydrolase YbcI (DUF457 family)
MPFTPYHVGPALLVALIMYPLLDIPTFIIATLVIDIEPLVNLILGNTRLHGVFHSLTAGLISALILAGLMYFLRRYTKPIVIERSLPQDPSFRDLLLTSIVGTWFHILLDAFFYSDVSLIYPFEFNPLLNLLPSSLIYNFFIVSFPLSIIIYLIRVTLLNQRPFRDYIRKVSYEEIQQPEPSVYSKEASENLSSIQSSNDFSNLPMEAILVDENTFEIELSNDTSTFPEIFIGTDKSPRQWGLIGKSTEALVGIDLNEPHIVFVCGKQGSGKGYTIGVISEMLLSKSIPNISKMRKSATIVVFHKPREDFRSEYWSIIQPNHEKTEINGLYLEYGLKPRQVISGENLRVFVDPFVFINEKKKFEEDYKTQVFPIGIKPNRLTAEDWPYVLSIGKKTGSIYVKKIFQIIKKTQYEKDFGLGMIRNHIEVSDLNPNQKSFANMRLETLQDYLEAGDFLRDLKLGGVNIFDLRKIMMEPDDIFSVMMLVISSILNNEKTKNEQFVFVINEAHEYLRKGLSKDFTDYINYLIRKKRHAGTWLLLDTHFPEDVDPKVIKGSDVKIFHMSDVLSSNILKQIVDGTPIQPHKLQTGQAIIRADISNQGPDTLLIVEIRPRLTHHGGATKTAI